ncbi:MAG: hypothetical protein ABH827_02040, partial [bacterium]
MGVKNVFIGVLLLSSIGALGYSASHEVGADTSIAGRVAKQVLVKKSKSKKNKPEKTHKQVKPEISTGLKQDYNAEQDIYKWFQTFAEVVGLVEKKAFRKVEFAKFIQDALKAAVSQVDAHSSFFMPKSYKSMMESTKGEFSGIGVSVITK